MEVHDYQLKIFNGVQTQFTEKFLSKLTKEEYDTMVDYLDSVQFIKNLISVDRKRASELDRWDNPNSDMVDEEGKLVRKVHPRGKIRVDIENPHILEDMDYFRQAAIHFEEHGVYTFLRPSSNPYSDYRKFWDEEIYRCWYGMVRESDGEWITGYHYWYLNYCPIKKSKKAKGSNRVLRVIGLPDIYDGDYLFFHYIERARENGKHCGVLKKRGAGYSLKGAGMLSRNFIVGENEEVQTGAVSLGIANEKEYLIKDGILNKFIDVIDFTGKNTPFPSTRDLKDSFQAMHWQMGRKNTETNSYEGSLNEVIGVTLKNDPEKARGKRAIFILWEEFGKFDASVKAWNIGRPSVEDGEDVFGQMVFWGTGGTATEAFAGLRELFFKPIGYNIYPLKNVWDKNTKEGSTCSFFHPGYLNQSGYMDENGNSDVIGSLLSVVKKRILIKYNSNDSGALPQMVSEMACVTGDTFVSNKSIGSGLIKDFDDKFINGIKDVYEFKLKSGRIIKCTNDHLIFNGTDYIEAGNYKPGDLVKLKSISPNQEYEELSIKGEFNFDNYNIIIDEDWARFIGLYMGDGNFYDNRVSIAFDERDIEAIEWFKKFVEDKFGSYTLGHVGERKMVLVNYHSKHLKNLFIQMDLIKKWNCNKHGYKRKIHVPLYIMNSPKSVIKEFLKGYFDADAGVITNQKGIAVYAKELSILKDVQILLTAFDIFTNVTSEIKINSEGREYRGNRIYLRSYEVDRFKEIGFISNRKIDVLNKHLTRTSKQPLNYNMDVLESFTYLGKEHVYDIQTKEECYSANGIWIHNCTPQEAIMKVSGNVFPVNDIKEYLEESRINYNTFVSDNLVGDLIINSEGTVDFITNFEKHPIRTYKRDKNNEVGAIEIFQKPIINPITREAYGDRYIAGIDPVDQDFILNGSLASIIVFDTWTDEIVAEYTGRPMLAEDFYETCRRLLLYYNAIGNYENNIKGLFGYFNGKSSLHLLCDTPRYLSDVQESRQRLFGNSSKGTRTTPKIILDGLMLQRSYMLSPHVNVNSEGEEIRTIKLRTIKSLGYLEEAYEFNIDGNFDRVSAMNMVMILRQERINITSSILQSNEDASDPYEEDEFIRLNYNNKNKNEIVKNKKYEI